MTVLAGEQEAPDGHTGHERGPGPPLQVEIVMVVEPPAGGLGQAVGGGGGAVIVTVVEPPEGGVGHTEGGGGVGQAELGGQDPGVVRVMILVLGTQDPVPGDDGGHSGVIVMLDDVRKRSR